MRRLFSWIFPVVLLLLPGTADAQNYTVYTVAGGGSPNQVIATSVGVQSPSSIARDGSGNLYVGFGGGVYKVDAAGILSVLATTAYRVNYVAADTAGNVYLSGIIFIVTGGGFGIAQTCSVQKIANGIVTDFVGHGTCDATSPLGPVRGLATGVNGDVYIADSTTVRRVSNGVISTIAGNGTDASSGDGGLATAASVQPRGIAVDQNGNVFISENHSPSGYFIRAVVNGVINRFAGGGTNANDGASSTAALLNSLSGYMVAGPPGSLYFSDSTRVRAIINSTLTTIAGGSTCVAPQPVCDGGPALNGSLSGPSGITFDASGVLYIADSGHQRIRTVSNGTINTLVGNGTGSLGDGISATDESLVFPSGVAPDNAGNLYLIDGNNALRKVAAGVISTLTNSSSGFTGEGLAIDVSGNFYAADFQQSKVFKYSTGGVVTTVAGNGSTTASGDGGAPTSAGVPFPNSVAVDALGNLYIASNSVIREVSASTGKITTIAGVLGKFGFSGDNGPATQALFGSQLWVAVDSSFNLYVGDSSNGRLRKITGGIVNTIASGFLFPSSVAVDGSGNVYLADASLIHKISNGVSSIIGGNGVPGFTGNGVPALAAQLCPDYLTVDSSGRVYFTDNCGNNVVRVLIPPPASPASPPNLLSLSPSSAPVGTASMNLIVSGSGFVNGNVVLWNGSPLPTTFVSGTILRATVGSALFSATGTALVSVGDSNSLVFTVTGPVINSLSPSSIGPGASTFTITVNGLNFVSGSTVVFNKTPLTTVFHSSTQLTATVPSSLLLNSATVVVYVLNLNAASNESVFTIGSPQVRVRCQRGRATAVAL